MTQHRPGDIHTRHRSLPDGFTRWRGGSCPVAPAQLVELMIHTDEGIGSSGIMQARLHDWEQRKGVGRIVGYRLHRPT